MKSEIFDSFVKIAQEKGLVSEDRDHEDSFKALEKNPRADSLDISAIEALYGTKPNTPKGMDYEHNIMEVAHPNSIVVSPSYDRLNGLVENEMERQNIALRLVYKTPDGLQTQRKYAEKELILSLVRLANHLDNEGKDDLRSLADFCLAQVSEQKIRKNAAAFLPIAVAVATVLGAVYLKNHMKFASDGLERDHQKLIAEIDDLLEANQSVQTTVGAGQSYRPEFIQLMQSFKTKLNDYFNLYKQQVSPILDQIEKPGTAQELMEMAKHPEVPNVAAAITNFKNATTELLPMVTKIEANFADEGYKARQIQEKGKLTSVVDWAGLHGGKGLVADDFDDVRHALETYVGDIQNVTRALLSAQNFQKQIVGELQQASTSVEGMFGEKAAPTPKPEAEKEVGGLDKDLTKLLGLPG